MSNDPKNRPARRWVNGWGFLTPETQTWERPALTDRKASIVRSYLLMRLLIGAMGVLLPLVLLVGDAWMSDATVSARGSLSAYYHSGMRDVFVMTLAMVGIFLITYKVFEFDLDNAASCLSGLSALGVALFPTGIPSGVNSPETSLQERLGADTVARFHYGFAAAFILSLALLSICFGIREGKRSDRPSMPWRKSATGPLIRKWIHWACAATIVGAIVFILVTKAFCVFEDYSLLIGEVVALVAFGFSWFYKGAEWDMLLPGLKRWSR